MEVRKACVSFMRQNQRNFESVSKWWVCWVFFGWAFSKYRGRGFSISARWMCEMAVAVCPP